MSKDCCPTETHPHEHTKGFDFIFHGSLGIIGITLILFLLQIQIPHLNEFVTAQIELFGKMWWGVILGITFVGLMSKIPREYFTVALGNGEHFGSLIRAAIAGLFLDLCSHGILFVGAKMYERGVSLPQIMTFLIASPWNSLSLTIILIALIGLKWTLVYIAGSALIAILTGMICIRLVKSGTLPSNPNKTDTPKNFDIKADAKKRLETFRPSIQFFKEILQGSLKESKMIIKWLLFGVIIAAAIRTFVPLDIFATWFGPTLVGLLLTLLATTIIEVCSEGAAPIASDLVVRGQAPGNGFAFLMAGVATDYTEIMVLREFTKSWKIALFLPLLTVPQVVVIGYILNLI